MMLMVVMYVMLGMTVVQNPRFPFSYMFIFIVNPLSASALLLAIIWLQPKDIETQWQFHSYERILLEPNT